MEWQCRNWLYFTWLSGDHIVEQHVHNLDVVNWAMGAMPKNVMGMGGRQVRVAPEYGNIFDHFAVEYEYPNGVRVSEHVPADQGLRRPRRGADRRHEGRRVEHVERDENHRARQPWTFEADETNPYVQEHIDLIASIRNGKPLNEGRQVAESTMCAIMGRMSAYTGRAISWEWAMNSVEARPVAGEVRVRPEPGRPGGRPGHDRTRLIGPSAAAGSDSVRRPPRLFAGSPSRWPRRVTHAALGPPHRRRRASSSSTWRRSCGLAGRSAGPPKAWTTSSWPAASWARSTSSS